MLITEHITLISTEGYKIFTPVIGIWAETLTISFRDAGFTYPHCPQFWDELKSVYPPVRSLNQRAEHGPASQALRCLLESLIQTNGWGSPGSPPNLVATQLATLSVSQNILKNTLKERKSDENATNSIISNTFMLPSASSSALNLFREPMLIQTLFEHRGHLEAKFLRLGLLLLSLAPLKWLTVRANTLKYRSF